MIMSTVPLSVPPQSSAPMSLMSPSQPAPPPHASRKETGLKHLFAGSVAGMASKTILQPLDLIKVRLQVQDGRGPNEYRGMFDAIQKVVRNEGALGLYRGLLPNLMSAGVSWGTYFFTYNKFKEIFKARLRASLPPERQSAAQLGPLTHLLCAAASGCIATTLTNPIVMVKTRLQLQGKEPYSAARQYTGTFDAFTRIVRDEGFFALYRGLGPSLVLVSNGALQFMCYEELKKVAIKWIARGNEDSLNPAHFFIMGGMAKIFSATITYPFALTRSRLFVRKPQTAIDVSISHVSGPTAIRSTTPIVAPSLVLQTSPSLTSALPSVNAVPIEHQTVAVSSRSSGKHADAKYSGMIDVFRHTWRYEGIRGFYRGLIPQLMKTAPSSAITFLIYETTIKFLNKAELLAANKAQQPVVEH